MRIYMIHKLISRYVRCEHVSSLATQRYSIIYQKLFRRSYIFCLRNVIMFMGSDRFQTYTNYCKLLRFLRQTFKQSTLRPVSHPWLFNTPPDLTSLYSDVFYIPFRSNNKNFKHCNKRKWVQNSLKNPFCTKSICALSESRMYIAHESNIVTSRLNRRQVVCKTPILFKRDKDGIIWCLRSPRQTAVLPNCLYDVCLMFEVRQNDKTSQISMNWMHCSWSLDQWMTSTRNKKLFTRSETNARIIFHVCQNTASLPLY